MGFNWQTASTIERRTEAIRQRSVTPGSGTSRQLRGDVEDLLAHIDLMNLNRQLNGTNEPVRARKIGGSYQAEGVIIATFVTTLGDVRCIFEFDTPKGMLHIFNHNQVEVL